VKTFARRVFAVMLAPPVSAWLSNDCVHLPGRHQGR
jgi:hypothetical protein